MPLFHALDIHVNGQPISWEEPRSVSSLLAELGLADKRVAVEINGEIVARSRHDSQLVQPGDRLEIVQAIGGG